MYRYVEQLFAAKQPSLSAIHAGGINIANMKSLQNKFLNFTKRNEVDLLKTTSGLKLQNTWTSSSHLNGVPSIHNPWPTDRVMRTKLLPLLV